MISLLYVQWTFRVIFYSLLCRLVVIMKSRAWLCGPADQWLTMLRNNFGLHTKFEKICVNSTRTNVINRVPISIFLFFFKLIPLYVKLTLYLSLSWVAVSFVFGSSMIMNDELPEKECLKRCNLSRDDDGDWFSHEMCERNCLEWEFITEEGGFTV